MSEEPIFNTKHSRRRRKREVNTTLTAKRWTGSSYQKFGHILTFITNTGSSVCMIILFIPAILRAEWALTELNDRIDSESDLFGTA
jgi:hypothetical protein